MEATRRPHPADPEFDPSPAVQPRLRDFDPLEHQRLVVNPFLAVLGLIGLGQATLGLFRSRFSDLAIVTIVLMAVLPYLIQYHCLDCGRTGSYLLNKEHACPGVLARWREGRRSRFPFPTPWAQLLVWGWVLGAVALLLTVLAST